MWLFFAVTANALSQKQNDSLQLHPDLFIIGGHPADPRKLVATYSFPFIQVTNLISNSSLYFVLMINPWYSDAYPWQISFQVKSNNQWFHTCGGSIIDDRTVVTAGHCCFGKGHRVLQVLFQDTYYAWKLNNTYCLIGIRFLNNH